MKKISIFLLILSVVFLAIFLYQSNFFPSLSKIDANIISSKMQEIKKEILTPPPLIANFQNSNSFLSVEGVINATNQQRQKNGLPPLKENKELDQSAKTKAADMLKNQYFAHESPLGVGVSDLAKNAGYDYIIIGENLAMGNFSNDSDLLDAWMNSPGHRDNILNSKYQEIGVSVISGEYEGKMTWMAVQHFGMPASACAGPNSVIKANIDSSEIKIKDLEGQINTMSKDIKNTSRWSPGYNTKVDSYNNLVDEYNTLIYYTKGLIGTYNNQIKNFNTCAGSE